MPGGERRRETVKILNQRGLHARASAKLVEATARFTSEITVTKDGYFPWDHLVVADRQPIKLDVQLVPIPD